MKQTGLCSALTTNMKNTIYLSIDIDFWEEKEAATRTLNRIFSRVPPKATKIAVMNHQQMCKYVDSSKATTLINVDQHSDVCTATINRFECGSWVSYVKWRKEGKYLWVRNSTSTSDGSCNGYGFGAATGWKYGSDWKELESFYKAQSFNVDGLCDFSKIVGVGLCLSPAYNADRKWHSTKYIWAEPLFRELVKKYKFPNIKGQRRETIAATRKPPTR
jgi:hypothetical protein